MDVAGKVCAKLELDRCGELEFPFQRRWYLVAAGHQHKYTSKFDARLDT